MLAMGMLPMTLVASLSLLVPIVAATTVQAPVCVGSGIGYATGQVNYLYNNFCQKLANSGFGSDLAMYGLPLISLSYTSAGAGVATCDQNNCLASFKTLVGGCGLANETIWGTGSLSGACGTYNFTIWDTEKNPVELGGAATTLIGATMTTAATIATATSTSGSSSSSAISSTLSEPTLISESSISSTITTRSSSVEPSDITSSSFLPTAPSYVNSTIIAFIAATTSAHQSAAANASGTTIGSIKVSVTKIDVGSTALSSGADIVNVGELSLVAVACVFAGLL